MILEIRWNSLSIRSRSRGLTLEVFEGPTVKIARSRSADAVRPSLLPGALCALPLPFFFAAMPQGHLLVLAQSAPEKRRAPSPTKQTLRIAFPLCATVPFPAVEGPVARCDAWHALRPGRTIGQPSGRPWTADPPVPRATWTTTTRHARGRVLPCGHSSDVLTEAVGNCGADCGCLVIAAVAEK